MKLHARTVLFLVISLSALFHLFLHLTIPPLNGHEWRQWDTFAVIRSFREEGMNILSPRTNQIYADSHHVDERLFLLDFPLYEYSAALLSFVTGLSFPTARIISAFSAGAVSGFVLLLVILSGYSRRVAILAVILLNLSPLFQFSAASVQPDMFMLMFLMFAVFSLWRDPDKHFISGLVAAIIATLIKPYSLLILFPFILSVWKKRKDNRYLLYIALPALAYGMWLLRGVGTASGTYWSERQRWSLTYPNSWNFALPSITVQTLFQIMWKILSPVVIVLSGLSFYLMPKNIHRKNLLYLLFGFLLYLVLFIPGNYLHQYYQLPLLPWAAILAAIGIHHSIKFYTKKIFIWIALTVLLIISLISQAQLHKDLFTQHVIYLELGDWPSKQAIIPKNKTVLLYNPEGSPVLVNMLNRNGWVANYREFVCEDEHARIRRLKPDYILIFNLFHEHPWNLQTLDNRLLTTCISSYMPEAPIWQRAHLTVITLDK